MNGEGRRKPAFVFMRQARFLHILFPPTGKRGHTPGSGFSFRIFKAILPA